MNALEIPDLISAIDERVCTKTGQCLTLHQKAILEQALGGKRLKDIQVEGYADDTVQRVFCPQLWHLLSNVTGQKVGIRTLPLVIKSLVEQPIEQDTSFRDSEKNATPISLVNPGSKALYETGSDIAFAAQPKIWHNLPAPTCSQFVGREAEIAQLLTLLSPQHGAQLISVDGIGGVGKTTLVLEAAYRCLRASGNLEDVSLNVPTFEAIVFTSAKRQFLAPFGLVERVGRSQRTLEDILQQIASTLDDVDIAGKHLEDQIHQITNALSLRRTLLIIDNLETLEDTQSVLSFLYCELPPTVKAVITTRQQGSFIPIRLLAMPEQEARHLIRQEALEKQVTLSEAEAYQLYQRTGGVPVAIHYAVGQMVSSYSPAYVLNNLLMADSDVARFCFEASINLLRDHPAHKLLMALTFFPAPVHRDVLAKIALSPPDAELKVDSTDCESVELTTERAFAQLRELSLVIQNGDRYTMLPLTQEYVISELKQHPSFEQSARAAWLKWCLELAETYGKQESWNWQFRNDALESEWLNIQPVIEWCMHQGHYDDLLRLWQCFEVHIHLQGDRPHCRRWWGVHLDWLNWLIQIAQQREMSIAAELITSRGWLLTAMGQPERLQEAEQLYTEAWQWRQRQPLKSQLNLAINIAALYVRQGKAESAQPWLDEAKKLVQQDPLERKERLMQWSRIYYYQGVVAFHTAAYESAKAHFKQAVDYAHQTNWQRVLQRARNWLADIALKEKDFSAAKQILDEGLASAQMSQDLYQLAFYQRSLAHLAYTTGDHALALQWGRKALQNFKGLDLITETQEIYAFLQTVQPEIQ